MGGYERRCSEQIYASFDKERGDISCFLIIFSDSLMSLEGMWKVLEGCAEGISAEFAFVCQSGGFGGLEG